MISRWIIGSVAFLCACSTLDQGSTNTAFSIPTIEKISQKPSNSFDSAGRLLIEGELFSGYLITLNKDSTLHKREGYWNGLLEGESQRYYPSGKLFSQRSFHMGRKVGMHQGWYESGAKKFTYYFEDGLSVGNHMSWYEDGQIFQNRNYQNGQQMGPQKIYRPDGKIRANYVVRENGRAYGLMGLKRCNKIDSETQNIDPYTGIASNE